MKRVVPIVCIILIVSIILAIPAFAAEQASHYFMAHSCYLWKVSDTHFQVWFDVDAVRGMDVLGASEIKVQISSDGVNWSTVQTNYNLFGYGTSTWDGHVDYTSAVSGVYYRARVTFYAEDDTGTGEYIDYTSSITMP